MQDIQIIPKIVAKPWGHEEWIMVTDKYALKRLVVRKGESLSTQYHNEKMETLLVMKGSCWLLLGEEGDLELSNAKKRLFSEGEMIHLNPKTVHSFEAIEDLELFEVSTPELFDVVRLEDRYGRESK